MTGSKRLEKLGSFRPDLPTSGHIEGKRGADARLWLHQSILEAIEHRPRTSKRLAIVTQQLAALGRSTIVKGCSDTVNSGWRRTPLGGQHGMHYYLWWSPQGTRQTKRFKSLKSNNILLRAVRHHDDHSPLNVGKLGDYHTLEWRDLDGESQSIFATPWTDVQQLFALEDSAVRLVYGYPGSGKTVALWRAVEARNSGRTLYLSWSHSLVEHARARFAAFAPPNSAVDARDFATFLGELCGKDVRRQSLVESREAFNKAFEWWKIADHYGPWRNRMDALHAELRSVLFGCAVPALYQCDDDNAKLSDAAYLTGGVSSVGRSAGQHVLELLRRSDWRNWYGVVFPEIAAARQALARLTKGHVPDGLAKFDRIVVDEAQDLTLLETAVVAQYCRALAKRRGHAPWLLLASDDGQTVRPSGFDAGRLNKLLNDWLTTPEEFSLEQNVRSPRVIAKVVERASHLYAVIRKGSRPVDQRSQLNESEGAAGVDARLIYAETKDSSEARELIGGLSDLEDVAMVTPEGTVPAWVPPAARNAVLTPEAAKGLEYSSVCVLDLGPVLMRLRHSLDDHDPLEVHERRTAIDRLRVALSRATENLVLIDVAPDDRARQLCLELLGNPERFTASDLIELFEDSDYPPDERILTRTNDARRLADVALPRAWERALQAHRLLSGATGEALVDDRAIQSEVCLTMLGVGARRLVDDRLDPPVRASIAQTTVEVAEAWGNPSQRDVVHELVLWANDPAGPPLDLLKAGLRLKGPDRVWLDAALASAQQVLREAIRSSARDVALAHHFAAGIEGILRVAGFMGDVAEETARLRHLAAEALTTAGEFKRATRMMRLVESPEPGTLAMISEGMGRHSQAGELFEQADSPEGALRNWRKAGCYEEALAHATGDTRADLQWMIEVEDSMRDRPHEIQNRLTVGERRSLTSATRMPAGEHDRPVRGLEELRDLEFTRQLAEAKGRKYREFAVESERSGRHWIAAEAYELAGMHQEAHRNWREAGHFIGALKLAKGQAKADLEWMIRTTALMVRRPIGLQDRLEPAERRRLAKAMRLPMRRKSAA